jgi:hypothetical protein
VEAGAWMHRWMNGWMSAHDHSRWWWVNVENETKWMNE